MKVEIGKSFYKKSRVYAVVNTAAPLLILFLVLLGVTQSHGVAMGAVLFFVVGIAQYKIYFPLHECSHYTLYRSKNVNRFFGHIFAGLLFTTFDGFRLEHIKHHATYGTIEDPGAVDYFVRFDSRVQMIKFLVAPLVAGNLWIKIQDYYSFLLNSNNQFGRALDEVSKIYLLIPVGIQGIVFLFLSDFGRFPLHYVVFYFLPAATVFLFLSRLRMFLEHCSLDYSEFDYLTNPRITARTIIANCSELRLLCGMNFNYHHEHHLYPQVPSSQLKKLHYEVTKSQISDVDLGVTYGSCLYKLWKNLVR